MWVFLRSSDPLVNSTARRKASLNLNLTNLNASLSSNRSNLGLRVERANLLDSTSRQNSFVSPTLVGRKSVKTSSHDYFFADMSSTNKDVQQDLNKSGLGNLIKSNPSQKLLNN